MALVLIVASANALADAMDASINVGSGQTGGKLVLETSGDVEVSLHRFANPAFGNAAAGVITAASLPIDDTSAAGGVVEHYSIYDRDDLKQLEGVVSVSGDDLDLSSVSVGVGDTVSLTAFTITVT